MGRPNFTDAKAAFIDTVTASYREASEARPKRIKIVLAGFYGQYFAKWEPRHELFGDKPFELLTNDEKDELAAYIASTKEKLHTTIRWNASKGTRIRSSQGGMSAMDKAVLKLLIMMSGTEETRAPQWIECFNKLFFITHVQPGIQSAMDFEGVDPKNKSHRMAIMHQVRKLAVDKLTAAELAEVDADYKRSVATYQAGIKMKAQLDTFDREEQAANREHLGPCLKVLLSGLSKFFGYSSTILMGGRDLDGRIRAVSMHHGETVAGNTFASSVEDFSGRYMAPFAEFIGRVHLPVASKKTEEDPTSIAKPGDDDPNAMKADAAPESDTRFTSLPAAGSTKGQAEAPVPASLLAHPAAVTPKVTAQAIAATFPHAVFTPEASQILHGSALHTGYDFSDPNLYSNTGLYQNNGNAAGTQRSSLDNGFGAGMSGFTPDANYWSFINGTDYRYGMADGGGMLDVDMGMNLLAGAAEMQRPLPISSAISIPAPPSFRVIHGPLSTVSNIQTETPAPAMTVPAKRKHVVDPVEPHLIQSEPRVRNKSAKVLEVEGRKVGGNGTKAAGKGKKAVQGRENNRKGKAKA